MFQELLTSIKGFLDISPEKRSTVYALLFCGMVIWYLYNENQTLTDKLNKKDADSQLVINRLQLDCTEQLRVNREIDQKQIDDFVSRVNNRSDSINHYYRKELRKSNEIINNQVNKLKNEINN